MNQSETWFASPHTHTCTLCFPVVQKLTLVHVNSNQCLDKASEEDSQVPSVRDCTHTRSQQWLLRNVTLPEVFWPHSAHSQTHTLTHTAAQSKQWGEWTCLLKLGTGKRKDFPWGDLGRGGGGGRIGRYYLCHRSEGGVCSTLLGAGREERLPLGDDGCCLTFVLCFLRRDFNCAEWLALRRE